MGMENDKTQETTDSDDLMRSEKRGRGSSGLTTKQEAKLIERAARARWNVSQEQRDKCLKEMVGLVGDSKLSDVKIAAAKTIVAMNKQDQDDLHLEEKYKRLDEGECTERIGGASPLASMDKEQLKRMKEIVEENELL